MRQGAPVRTKSLSFYTDGFYYLKEGNRRHGELKATTRGAASYYSKGGNSPTRELKATTCPNTSHHSSVSGAPPRATKGQQRGEYFTLYGKRELI